MKPHSAELGQVYGAILGSVLSGVTAAVILIYPADEHLSIVRAKGVTPVAHTPLSQEEWQKFERDREALLASTLTLKIEAQDSKDKRKVLEDREIKIPIAEHPEWITVDQTWFTVSATLDPLQVGIYLTQEVAPLIPPAEHLRISALPKEGARTTFEGRVRNGWQLQTHQAADIIARTVGEGLLTVPLPIQPVSGTVINETGKDLGALELLSQGRSNFRGSVSERVFNIKKALDEHLNGILILPGETFSFNQAIGGTVEEWGGWAMALGIFNGTELKPTPGGGICQTSTTMYRAALALGLPIEEQRNHSKYIHYYAQYGEGLDATIFIGHQDLQFINDTGNPIVVHAYHDGPDAFIEFYGTADGRTVALAGPYRKNDAPEDLQDKLGWWDIAWKQTITKHDGSTEEHVLISRYQEEIPYTPTPYSFGKPVQPSS